MSKKGKKSLAYSHVHFLSLLSKYANGSLTKKNQFKNLILNASDAEINALSELILNILKGNLPCKKSKFVKNKASHIRIIGDKKNPIKKRKNILIKKGHGFILPLLSVAIPALIDLFSKK